MKRWVTKRYDFDAAKIAGRYQVSEIFAEVLVKRGLFNWEAMDGYLFPKLTSLRPIQQMKDAVEAAELLQEKIQQGKPVLIVGDYDVDGVMSTYILYRGIELLGGKAGYRIPHRVRDGYGMRDYMADEAYAAGYDTVITCDNGISAWEAVGRAKELGMTVILTDHHEVPKEGEEEQLPPADVVVDPKQQACGYPFKQLCGAGIAYKLMMYLLGKNGQEDAWKELLPFAAIATVCDVVPLFDENRILVKNGLELLGPCPNIGLQALLGAQQFNRKVTAGDLGFRIGPCINAAGRLGSADLGLELLLEKDKMAAERRAAELVALNEQRKDYTAEATNQAIRQIEDGNMLKDRVLVVFVENCHESVAGIVAGRIREKYYRPVLLVTRGEKGLKGSGRSIPGYHMQQELSGCKELLAEYGGHAMAAGFSLPEKNLERLREKLNKRCTLTEQQLTEQVSFDKEVPLGEFTEQLVKELAMMEPFGEGNQRAVFAKRGVVVSSVMLCGRENQIARLRLRDGMRLYSAVDFQCESCLGAGITGRYGENAWEQLKSGNGKEYEIDILYQPSVNEKFGGVEFKLVDCR